MIAYLNIHEVSLFCVIATEQNISNIWGKCNCVTDTVTNRFHQIRVDLRIIQKSNWNDQYCFNNFGISTLFINGGLGKEEPLFGDGWDKENEVIRSLKMKL
jgi:hypothetical protein